MPLDTALLVLVAVMLYARVGAGRAVPLSAFVVACGTWVVLLLAGLGAQMFGALTRLAGLDPNATYYATSPLIEVYGIAVSAAHALLGTALLVAVLVAAALTPVPARQAAEPAVAPPA